MINVNEIVKGFKTPESRWAKFGPYYAMFPIDFAFDVIEKYSKKGDFIIDPFAGRCSSVYAGGVLGRHSLGIEINPVGWLYGIVKIEPADKQKVIDRLLEIYSRRQHYVEEIQQMHTFYRMCYCDEVLKFLLASRALLNWKTNNVDATLMSILLVYLQGKLGEGLSNQLKMTKAMGINYCVDWWKERDLVNPPEINPFDFLLKKVNWRYEKGVPSVFDSNVVFGDSVIELKKIVQKAQTSNIHFSLLFTSPPYYSITDYYKDQWLRLWLLGGPEIPKATQEKHKGRFDNKEEYYQLLDGVFGNCTTLMANNSTVYVRTDRREFTFDTTLKILRKHFPNHKETIIDSLYKKKTQTELHGNKSSEVGEVDIIMIRE